MVSRIVNILAKIGAPEIANMVIITYKRHDGAPQGIPTAPVKTVRLEWPLQSVLQRRGSI